MIKSTILYLEWLKNKVKFFSVSIILVLTLLLNSCWIAVGSAVVGGVLVYKRHDVKTVVSDEWIESQINNDYYDDVELWENNRVIVTCLNGNVLLIGEVRNEALRDKAIAMAKATDGVQRVYNQIEIGTPVSIFQQAKDAFITSVIKTKMIFTFENNFDPSAIKVVTNNNVVYLMGVVGPELADQASDIASKSVGVEKVVRVFQYIT